MKDEIATLLRCPGCGRTGCRATATTRESGEIRDGRIECEACHAEYPIINFIPRLVPADNYASSFGFQWNLHARTQVDRADEHLSHARFVGVTGWPEDLRGQRVLEAGSGAGRFTAIVVATGAQVFTFDYSNAVDANLSNQGLQPNLHLLQADIFRIPFAPGSFDKVVCLGVLQHTPDPARAFQSLVDQVAPGGQIVIDVYRLKLNSFVSPKYLLRPITRRMPAQALYGLVSQTVRALLPVKRWLSDRVPFGRYPAHFIPVAYQTAWATLGETVSEDRMVELSVLDTFDWYAPRFDKPQTRARVQRWFEQAGLVEIEVKYGPNGIVGRGTKPTG